MAEFLGTAGNDLLIGTSGDDVFLWQGGDDIFLWQAGDDTIDGGSGVDALDLGYAPTDVLVDLPAGLIQINGNTLSVTGVEKVYLDGNESHFIGDDADNIFRIFGGNTTMSGGGGNDRLSWDGWLSDLVFLDGGAGDDILEVFGIGTVSVSGGTGLDRVTVLSSLQGANPATVSLNTDGSLMLEGRGTSLSIAPDIEEIAFYFDINPDLTMLTLSFAELAALAPSFHIGTEGNDVLTGTGLRDQINGLGGNDWLLPGAGRDSIDGGAGVDMLSYVGLEDGPVWVFLQGGFSRKFDLTYSRIGNDTFTGVEGVTGTAYGDYLAGFDGADVLRGGRGDDTLAGSAGADVFDGGSGRDSADYSLSVAVGETGASGINASLLRGRGWTGDAAGDRYSGIENLEGSILDDHLAGDHAANRLYGMHGDDTLIGLGGDDYIYGGIGADTAIFGYDRDQYSITQNGLLTTVTYIGAGTGDGTDTLLSVEQLQFADELVIL